MKTRHFFGAMALALASLTLASCSGGGSSDSGLFGALPGEMTRYESEMKALEEKAKDIKTEADKKKLIAESQEIQEKYNHQNRRNCQGARRHGAEGYRR